MDETDLGTEVINTQSATFQLKHHPQSLGSGQKLQLVFPIVDVTVDISITNAEVN